MDQKLYVLMIITLFTFSFILTFEHSIMSDEGTHMILSLFYRDLLKWIVERRVLSFQKIYAFSLSYLIHYPKLQVFYPPLYHLITGNVFYSLLGVNEYAARLCNFSFYILSTLMVYYFSKRIVGKHALLSALAFSIYPVSFYISFLAMKDMAGIFFSLLAIYLYLTLSKSLKNSFILGLISSLAMLSERSGIIVLLVILFHSILKKQLKYLVAFILGLSVLMLPYAFLIVKINGLEINRIIYQSYGFLKQFNARATLLLSPLIFLLLLALFKERSGETKSFFSLWFCTAFITIFFMTFKPRFFQYFLLPLFVLSGKFFGRRKLMLTFFICYSTLLNVYFIATRYLPNYPVKEVASYVYENLPKNANVALMSEDGDKLYSSSFMFPLSTMDRDKSITFLRPCYFEGRSRGEVLDILKNNGVYFVIAVKDDLPEVKNYEKVLMIKDKLEKVFEKNHIEIYRFKEYKPPTKVCNYICTTKEVLCTPYDSPFSID